jgi:hypothetical protein
MVKHKGRPKPKSVIHTAMLSLRREVKWFFVLSVLTILTIELILKNFPAPNQTIYRMGDVLVKLCFSIVASTIFFFINQQIPKEYKKIKSYVFVHNCIGRVANEISTLFNRLGVIAGHKVTLEILRDKLNKIDPTTKVVISHEIVYEDWRTYFLHIKQISNQTINDLLPFHEHIDTDILQYMLTLNEILASFEKCDRRIYQQKEWFFLAEYFMQIYDLNILCSNLANRKFKDTHQQYMYRIEKNIAYS